MENVRIIISNSFSVNMLTSNTSYTLTFVPMQMEHVRKLIEFAIENNVPIISIVGHESTAKLLSQLLNIDIKVNRINYTLQDSDLLLVFVVPVRLPEGRVLNEEELEKLGGLKIWMVCRAQVYSSLGNIIAVIKP